MKHLFLLTSVIILLSATGIMAQDQSPGDSLTVNQAVERVLASNPSIFQAAHAIDAAKAQVDVSRSSLYPNANISLGYTRIGPVPSIAFPGFGIFQLAPYNNFDEHLAVNDMVYDFGRRQKGIDLAKTQVLSTQDRLQLVRQDLAYQTINTFYAMLFMERSIKVQNDEINTLTQHLLITQKMVAAGTATAFDVLTTQVRVAAAEDQKISLENSLANLEISFRRLLGLPAGAPVNLAGGFSEAPIGLNLDSLLTVAMEERIEIKAANDQIATARAQYNTTSVVDNPSLNVALEYGFKNGYEPNLNAWLGNYVAAVQLQVPISKVVPFFGGYQRQNMEQEFRANIQAAEANKKSVIQQVTASVEKGVADLHSSMDRLQTTDITVQQAETALKLARIRYEAGTITNLDLLDAETAVAQARLERLQALYTYVIGRYELQQAIGEKAW